MAHHRGDDLDDDFMPDEIVALSEDEGFASLVGDQDNIGNLLSADEEEGGLERPHTEQTMALLEEKKRRRREKEKERKAKKRKLDETAEAGFCHVALRSPTMISEYLSTMQAKSLSKMSTLELQDRLIPGRELHSGHDGMDGIEELGHIGGVYCASGPPASHTTTAEDQIIWFTHTTLSDRCSFKGSECDSYPQKQNAAG